MFFTMISLVLVLVICMSFATVAQQSDKVSSPCASILESAIYKNMYLNADGADRPSASYHTFMLALCSLPPGDELPLPLSAAAPTLLAAFKLTASALSKLGSQPWEYPGEDYDASSFATSNMLQMVKNLNKAVCCPDKYTVHK